MSIIKLKEPWAFFASEEITQGELEELQKHFVDDSNHGSDWLIDEWNGIGTNGISDWHIELRYFDEKQCNKGKVTVYTIEQLRDIIAEHLAKQPVEPESVTKFVVGKWYKWFQKDHSKTHKGKCVSVDNSFVEMNPWIWNSESYSESGTFTLKEAEDIELIEDLSEIQDLLPEGHPDKQTEVYLDDKGRPLKEFKVGRWYTNPKLTPRKLLNGNPACFFRVSSCKREVGYDGKYYFNTLKFDKVADKDWNIEVCENSHSNINYDQEMVEVFPPTRSERYLATMKFFEQLKEPERSESIANYDEDYSIYIPKSLESALSSGFCWDNTEQESDYWEHIHGKLLDNTYFKEELLMFGKYNIGDIVVRTFGEPYLYKIAEGSTKDCLRAVEGGKGNFIMSDWSESWRPATPEEVEAYNQGVRNIADIKPKDYKEAVHCTTQEEWDFVLSKFNGHGPSKSAFNRHKENCLTTVCNKYLYGYCSKKWHIEEGYTILTFKQWCEKYGHSYEVVPEYVECVRWLGDMFSADKIYHIVKGCITSDDKGEQIHFSEVDFNFKPSTKEAYDEQQGKLKMEELLSEAKRRYPAETKVRAVVDGPKLTTEVFTLTDSHYWASGSQAPACYTEKGHPVCLHLSGIWAEIIKEEPWVAQVGDWVYVLDKGTAYKLKKGEIRKCVQVATSDKEIALSEKQPGYWLKTGEYRKATQEEIDSVTKQVSKGLGLPLVPEWTSDNWYVEVSSQEEANAVIDAASKMYGEPYDKYFAFNDEWKYVGLCHKNKDYTLLSRKFIHVAAKPRPITDFIQPEKPTLLETVKKTFFDKPTQQATPDDSYIFAGEVTEEEFNEIKRLCKPQQDELVIYKPKQTRFVEPGAVSASVSTTNLIIKSNSKYL